MRLGLIWLGLLTFLMGEAQALCTSGKKANLRKGPNTREPITLEAIPYTPLRKVKKLNGWYQVKDVDSQIHWVREDLVTQSFQCAVIKTEFANLRKGPGKNFPRARGGMGEKYLSFRVIKIKNDWVQVEDLEGDEVWIKSDLVWIQ